MDKHPSSPAAPPFERRLSFRDVQNAITKINPEVVKTVIASVVHTSPTHPHDSFRASTPIRFRPDAHHKSAEPKAPMMTIFYNGTVSVFDVPQHKAESIIKFATEGSFSKTTTTPTPTPSPASFNPQQDILQALNRGMPIAPKKSLRRFFDKRKERLISVSPYPIDLAVRSQKRSF